MSHTTTVTFLHSFCPLKASLLNFLAESTFRGSKTIVSQVDLTAKLCLPFCLELQSAESTYHHVDLDLYSWNTQRLEFESTSSGIIRVFFTFQNDLQKQNWDQQDTKLT